MTESKRAQSDTHRNTTSDHGPASNALRDHSNAPLLALNDNDHATIRITCPIEEEERGR
jgi:hypothetical protein